MDTAAIRNGSLSKPITASVKQISPSELSPVEKNVTGTIIVGSGTYGECVVKQMRRFGIMVIEKLPKCDLREVMNEAQCMNASIPHLFGVQIEQKPFSLIMQYFGEGRESVTVHKLLHQTLAKK